MLQFKIFMKIWMPFLPKFLAFWKFSNSLGLNYFMPKFYVKRLNNKVHSGGNFPLAIV